MPPKPLLAASLGFAQFSSLRFPLLASPKIDGIRALAEGGKLFSRSGKLIPNLFLQERAGAAGLHGQDGELVIGPPNSPSTFKATRGPVMTAAGSPAFHFWVFDNWAKEVPYPSRIVTHHLLEEQYPFVKVVKQKLVRSKEDLLAYEEWAIAEGYEGIMLRDPTKLYKQGRSTLREATLLKLKRFLDDEAVIIGWEERMSNQNEDTKDVFGYAKRSTSSDGLVPCGDLGAWIVKMLTGKFSGVACKVGTGFTAHERQLFWKERESMLGQICTIKWFEPGSDKAPRLPSWKGLRGEGE